MNINTAFPSKYLKSTDLQGRRATVEINSVEMQTIGKDEKLVLYFKDKSKGLVLNKTNAITISEIVGSEDTDNWPGVMVVIYPTKTDFQGKRVDTIRVDWPADAIKPKLVNADGEDVPF